MIYRLFESDAFEMLARGIARDELAVALDVGANAGGVASRIRGVFPKAVVYAFEPASGPFEELLSRAGEDPGIRPVRAAAGDRDGEIVLNETRNSLLTSVLAPSDRTVAETHGAGEVVSRRRVRLVRLDSWAREEGIDAVDLLKLDVQGFELAVLGGMGELLGRTRAVYAEAHLEPAYEGAATFSEIDLFLRDRGLVLHQIHEIMTRGDDLQTLQLDALWLCPDLLETIRRAPLERVTPPWAEAVGRALDRCARAGLGRVALYGAGMHTQTIEPSLDEHEDVRVVAVIDDDPGLVGQTVAGRPVISACQLDTFGIEGVILSSDSYEDELWRRTAPLRRDGIRVFRLYGREVECDDIPGVVN